jgi:hypothetical protein
MIVMMVVVALNVMVDGMVVDVMIHERIYLPIHHNHSVFDKQLD